MLAPLSARASERPDFLGSQNGYFCTDLFATALSDDERLLQAYLRAITAYGTEMSGTEFANRIDRLLLEKDYYRPDPAGADTRPHLRFIATLAVTGHSIPGFDERIREALEKLAASLRGHERAVEESVRVSEKIPVVKQILPLSHDGRIRLIRANAESTRAITVGQSDKKIIVWDLEAGLPSSTLHSSSDVKDVRTNSSFTQALVHTNDELVVRDLRSARRIHTLMSEDAKKINGIAADESLAHALSLAPEEVTYWDLVTGKSVRAFQPETGIRVLRMKANSDLSRVLLCLSDGTIRVWNPRTGEVLRKLEGHAVNPRMPEQVRSIDFDPNFKRAVSAGQDGTVLVWDLEKGKAIQKFEYPGQLFNQLRISSDLERVAIVIPTDFFSSRLEIREIRTGALLLSLDSDATMGSVGTFFEFTPDLRRGASANTSGALRIWDLESGKVSETLEGWNLAEGLIWGNPADPRIFTTESEPKGSKLVSWDLRQIQDR